MKTSVLGNEGRSRPRRKSETLSYAPGKPVPTSFGTGPLPKPIIAQLIDLITESEENGARAVPGTTPKR